MAGLVYETAFLGWSRRSGKIHWEPIQYWNWCLNADVISIATGGVSLAVTTWVWFMKHWYILYILITKYKHKHCRQTRHTCTVRNRKKEFLTLDIVLGIRYYERDHYGKPRFGIWYSDHIIWWTLEAVRLDFFTYILCSIKIWHDFISLYICI